MDTRDNDSSTGHEAIGHVTDHQGLVIDISNFPSHVNILKPQIDKIFSEVQKNLPTIDFDSSDVSSDGDEPIFFHQNLKLSELSSVFDDDKDLDTSLSQGDEPLCLGNSSDNLPLHNNGKNTNIAATIEDENDDNCEKQYDNDLVAFMSKVTAPTEDDLRDLHFLAIKMEDTEAELEKREEADLKRSQNLGHFSKTSFSSEPTILCRTTCTSEISDDTENKEHGEIIFETKGMKQDNKNINVVDVGEINLELDTGTDANESKDSLPVTVKKFNQRLNDGMRFWDSSDNRRFTKNTKIRDDKIISKFTLQEPTTLSLRLFEELDLDSVLNAANEEGHSWNRLQAIAPHSSNLFRRSHNGGGDKKTETEDLTLIQKLAQLSALHSGTDTKSINSLDPQTGAARIISGGTYSASLYDADMACQTQGVATSCAGTNTSSGITATKVLYGRLKHEKRDSGPQTVFIDLRGFEKQKEDERMGLKNVQRVLRIEPKQGNETADRLANCALFKEGQQMDCADIVNLRGIGRKEDLENKINIVAQNGRDWDQNRQDESSSDDEERVERCDWRLTRQRIKENLSAHGASSSFPHPQRKAFGETGNEPKYKKPPRVIDLKHQAVGKQWTRPVSETKTAVEMSKGGCDEEADNKSRIEKLERDEEKEHQRKEIMKQREEREKVQEQRMQMREHIANGRSVATTQGKQPAGENTPILFDIEVSYEQAPTTLPKDLARETLLLTVHLSSNGEIMQHRNRSNHSMLTEEGLSATYITLLSWLLSLVPQEDTTQTSSLPSADKKPGQESTFNVVGLQQLWLEEELRLYVVVAPSDTFYSESGRHSFVKKSKKDGMKGWSRFAQHITKFLSGNTLYTACPWLSTLVPVEVRNVWPEDKDAVEFTYTPPLPKISTKPLSKFIQVNPDEQAARKVFNIPVGFLWQTVDNEEAWHSVDSPDEGVGYETQNTVSLIYSKVFHNPVSVMAILSRVVQEGLDLAGARLLYPCSELLKTDTSRVVLSPDLDTLKNVGPVLALALRGTFVRTVWLDAVGPSDPLLARRTDPNSLCALFGGDSRDNVLLFCPRNPSRTESELTRWFGGRIPEEATSVDVGMPYLKKEDGRGKRCKKTNTKTGSDFCSLPTQRPPSALTATCRSDIFLVVSPLVSGSYFGVLLATCQRRGYQIRGVKKLLLTSKMAGSLGISKNMQRFFCPGVSPDELGKKGHTDAIAPCTVFLLRKENAAHNMQSLIEAIMVQLTMAGLLGCVQMRVDECLTSRHLFNGALYTDALLGLMGGNLAKVPEYDLSQLRPAPPAQHSTCQHLEQFGLVIMLGHDLLKACGIFVAKILNVVPYSKTPVQAVMTERFELLGLKWVPELSIHQAKELTPYEVGERLWRQSVHALMAEPALVLVLRGVNIFNVLKPVIDQQQLGPTATGGGPAKGTSLMVSNEQKIEVIMSHNPGETDAYTRLFFHENELFPDPLSHSLLPYLPELSLYFSILEKEEDGNTIRVFSLKPQKDLDLTRENIMETIGAGQEPITTLLLIKPRAVQKHLHKILRKIVQEQFGIVGLRLFSLPLEIVDSFIPLSHKKDTKGFQKHIEAFTSGPAVAVALQQENAVKILCELIGPEDPANASRQSQFLWRAEFGSDIFNNGLYCSANYIDAVRDVKLLFPDGVCCNNSKLLTMEQISAPAEDGTIDIDAMKTRDIRTRLQPCKDSQPHFDKVQDVHHLLLQTTCLVLTPSLMMRNPRCTDVPGVDLLAMFLNNGFELVAARLVWLTQRQAERLLCMLGGGSFQQMTVLCSGPCLVLAMQRDNAVVAFNSILNKHSEDQQLMANYAHQIIQPNSIAQAQSLMTFFFDRLVPGSQLTITSRLRHSYNEDGGPEQPETAGPRASRNIRPTSLQKHQIHEPPETSDPRASRNIRSTSLQKHQIHEPPETADP